ncbi:hypothetical protein OKW30_000235 [Paraburkholderia sp. Clong3]|nr:hypothetical protein [Paraburkholderia sp. CI2]
MLPIGRLRRGHTRVGRAAVAAAALSLTFIVRGALHVPIEGSVALFLAGAALHLFATTSMGIFMATLERSMPQFAQNVMLAAPTTHFVELGQAILFRGAGIAVVWQPFRWLAAIRGHAAHE